MLKTKLLSEVTAHVELYYTRAKAFYLHSEFRLSYQSIQKGLQIKPGLNLFLELLVDFHHLHHLIVKHY